MGPLEAATLETPCAGRTNCGANGSLPRFAASCATWNSAHGIIMCPEGARAHANCCVPRGREDKRSYSPSPTMYMVFLRVSMSIRPSLAAFNPRSAGSLLPGTIGVSKVPETDLPSVFNNATGNTQLCVHFSPPCPTPRTVSGRPRRFMFWA